MYEEEVAGVRMSDEGDTDISVVVEVLIRCNNVIMCSEGSRMGHEVKVVVYALKQSAVSQHFTANNVFNLNI